MTMQRFMKSKSLYMLPYECMNEDVNACLYIQCCVARYTIDNITDMT